MAKARHKDTGTDVGPGLAYSYYYGFLKLTLPGMKDRIAASEFSDSSRYCRIFPKALLLLPRSCFCPSTLAEECPTHIAHVGFIPFRANRAGNVARDYKSSVYEVTNPDNHEEKYLVIAELATPLMSMYEMHLDGLADFPEARKQEERTKFMETLNFILTHPKASSVHNTYTFLPYDDPRDSESNRQYNLAKIICEHVRQHLP
jgi:hypothetical protein